MLNQLADEVFELSTVTATLRSRARRARPEELSEPEFLALHLLAKYSPITVGQIQQQIGILPAQMSRIIRSLEGKGAGPLVRCSINEQDRRKINVELTDAGRVAHETYRAARRVMTIEFLSHLSQEDRATFMRLIRSFRERIAKALKDK